MTEVINTKLPLEERMRLATKKYYNNKIKTDKEFYDKEKLRVVEYIKNRYANDPEYKENLLRKKREYYAKKKEEKKKQLEIL